MIDPAAVRAATLALMNFFMLRLLF